MTEPQDPFAPQPPAAPQPYGAPAPPPYGAPLYGEPLPAGSLAPGARRNGLGTAALVLGIIAIIPCSWFFLVPAVLALVFGLVGRSRVKKQQATNGGAALTGVVLGGLALIPGVLFWALIIGHPDALQRYNDCTAAANGDTSLQDECVRQYVHDVVGYTLPGRE